MRTAVILLLTEDLFELVIQVVFLLAVSKEQVGVVFWLSVAGTVLHISQKGTLAWMTWRALPALRLRADGREKVSRAPTAFLL